MKSILNICPVLVFFIFYKFYDIFLASKSLIISSGLICILHWIIYKKIDKMNLFSFITILIFGFLTIFFHNSQFIKLKITVMYIIFSCILLVSQFCMKTLLIKNFLEKKIILSNIYWKKINFCWALFFLFCSILNLYISFYFSEIIWVNFKVFGLMILTLFFIAITGIYINSKK